jgi:hypothetical protein
MVVGVSPYSAWA